MLCEKVCILEMAKHVCLMSDIIMGLVGQVSPQRKSLRIDP